MSTEKSTGSKRIWSQPTVLRLIIFNLVAIICVGQLAFWTTHYIKLDVQSDTKASLETVLQTTHEGLHIWAHEEALKLERISRNRDFLSSYKALLNLDQQKKNLLKSQALENIRKILSQASELSSSQGYFAITPDGRSIASMRDNNIGVVNPIKKHRPKLFQRALKGETVFIPPMPSDVALSGSRPIAGKKVPPTMFFLTPIRDKETQVIGLLSERVDPHGVFSSLTALGRIGDSGETYLIDKAGYLITESRFTTELRKLKILRNNEQDILSVRITDPGYSLIGNDLSSQTQTSRERLSLDTLHQRPLTLMAKSATEQKSGFNVEGYRDYRGVYVLGVWLWDQDLNFGMTTEIDVDEALQAYFRARDSIYLIVGVAITIALVFSVLSARLNMKSERILLRSRDELEEEVQQRTKELSENRARLQVLIDSIPALIYLKTSQGKYELINQRFVDTTGLNQSKVIGQSDFDIFPEALAESVSNLDRRALRTWSQQTIEERIPTASGEMTDFLTIKVPIRDSLQNENAVLGISMDISDRKALESQLLSAKEAAESANETKSNFLASMSHEIRTPMNGIIGMLQLALKTQLTSDQWRKINTALSSAESLLSILNDILDFSKVEAGKMELEHFDFNLRELMENTVNSMTVKAHERNLELMLDLSNINYSMVVGDPGRIRQVLLNLISNAIKFSEDSDILIKAELTVDPKGQYVLTCSVRDRGIGIPAAKVGSMFDLFTQADVSTTRKYGGTGLGLAICKKLVELMGGKIHATSKEGEGSTFTFTTLLAPSSKSEMVAPQNDIAGKHILVVDDNPTNLEIFLNQLTRWQVEVYPAQNADEALALLEKHHIDMVLLDMEMPEKDGIQLATEIRASGNFNDLRLALMSSVSLESNSILNDLGFSSYLIKPVTTSDLLETLTIMAAPLDASGQPMLVTKARLHALNKGQTTEHRIWDKNSRILVVEDNHVNQQVITELMLSLGLHCELANHGEEALTKLSQSNATYDLIFMDCQMPVMDGFTATEAIRKGKAGDFAKTIPIVALTANALQGDRDRCLNAGMNDYLAKPIIESEMVRCLNQWLPKADKSKESEHTSKTKGQTATIQPSEQFSLTPYQVSDNKTQATLASDSKTLIIPDGLSCFSFPNGLPVLAKRPESYVRVLKSYLAGADNFSDRFKQMVTEKNTEGLLSEIHAMKGVSGNIGIDPVYTQSLSLEKRMKAGEFPKDDLDAFNLLVEHSLKQAQILIDANDKPDEKHKNANHEAAKLEIISQLQHSKYIDETLLQQFIQSADQRYSEAILESIIKNIHEFSYQAALDLILKSDQEQKIG